MESKPRLSCEQCRRRKTKCDKKVPCSSCKAAGIACEVVQRNRLPRGKSGKSKIRGSLLETRVARIESLLAQAQSTSPAKDQWTTDGGPPAGNSAGVTQKSTLKPNGYAAPDFWDLLAQEVAGLRDTLDEDSDDETNNPDISTAYGKLTIACDHKDLLFPGSPQSSDGYCPPYPSHDLRAILLTMYGQRFHPFYRPLHLPTIAARIEAANAQNHQGATPALIAIEFSLYFIALCALRPEEASAVLPNDSTVMLQQYMHATEWALAQCNIMQKPDLDTLLAFVLYLNCIWACGKYATKWTLIPLAVRLGEALGLGREDPRMYTPFDLECRRRLWWCIAIMDTHSMYDRGSPPLMAGASLGQMPLNINDADMSPDSKRLEPSPGFTDMAFPALAMQAVACVRRLNEAGDWVTKLQIVQDYETIAQRAINLASGDTPVERGNREGAKAITCNMNLMLRRPPYRVRQNVVPAYDDFDIMGCCITVLESWISKRKGDLAAYDLTDWIPWYALAVALAELCKSPTGPIADRAWAAALELYQRCARPASDIESGILWKPITKLMRRVQRERPNPDADQVASQQPSTKPSQPSLYAQQQQQQQQQQPQQQQTQWHDTQGYAQANLFFAPVAGYGTAQPQQTMPMQAADSAAAWTKDMPAWPAFNPTDSMIDMNSRDPNIKVMSDLNPANGVSWLDWDTFLDDQGYPLHIG